MISVVHAVIINPQHQALLLKRSDHLRYAPGQWCWPGGRIEIGESPIEALQREMLEEIGTGVVVKHAVHAYELKTPLDEWKVHPYLCKLEGSFELQGDEHTDSSWVSLDQFDNYECARGVQSTLLVLKEHLSEL